MRFVRVIVTLASMALAATQAFGATGKFATPVTYGSGAEGANAVVAADVNNDGHLDLVVATNNGVSVLLNNGDGTYAAATSYGTGGTLSESVVVADINNDGKPDIVVTSMCLGTTGCSGVAVLLGNGDGTFQPAVGYASGGLESGGVVVGDLNGDGWADLVVTSNCQIYTCVGGTTNVLLNNGDGTFATAVQVADNSGPVALGDMNNDGILDLVTAAGVMLGNGDGTFQLANSTVVGGANSIALADVNNDGILDVMAPLAAGEGGAGQVAVQLGNGDGTLQSAVNFPTGGANPLIVAIADYNGDTFPDIAVINECGALIKGLCPAAGTASVSVLNGNGDGTFNLPATYFTGGAVGTSIVAADVNGDTKKDLVATNACASGTNCNSGSVGVLMNVYVAPVSLSLTTSLNPAILGQSVTFTASLVSALPIPDGESVTFSSNGTVLGTAATSGGVASLTTSFTPTGKYTITAAYPGDPFHSPKSTPLVEKVVANPTTTVLTISPATSGYGQAVTLTAVVTSSGGVIPTGTVKFINTPGSATLDSTGTATFTTVSLPVGTRSITASYSGDSTNAASTSSVVVQTVNQAQITISLSLTPNPSTFKQSVTFTATLTSTGAIPSGAVLFSSNGKQIGSAGLKGGVATFSTKALPSGSDVVTATFNGNTNYSSASTSTTETVN